jgi:hypothetical protein
LAGLGRKVFNSGDILLASEVQGYLQDQAVMVFDDSATRATAIGTANFSEGMVTYTKDDDAIQVYDGSDFVGVGSDSGLIHINTQTFSAVASLSLDNVFSATYTNYKVFLTVFGSTEQVLSMRMRVGGTDNSAGSYNRQILEASSTTVSASRATNQTSWPIGQMRSDTNVRSGYDLTVFNPFNAINTMLKADSVEISGGADTNRFYNYTNVHKVNTSYDGFTIFVAGTMTGEISVYGLGK